MSEIKDNFLQAYDYYFSSKYPSKRKTIELYVRERLN
jgi:hypothetical protein